MVLVAAGVLLIGPTIDVSRWNAAIGDRLSQSFGRAVRVDGRSLLRVSLWPGVHVTDLRVANPEGFAQADFVSFGEIRVDAELLPFVRQRLVISAMRAADVRIDLEQRADGRVNWLFAPAAVRRSPAAEAPDAGEDPLEQLGLNQLDIERLRVTFTRPDARHEFAIDRLEAQAPVRAPLGLSVRGTIDQRFPYEVKASGAPLAQLVSASAPWTFEAALTFLGTVVQANGAISADAAAGRSLAMQFGAGTGDLVEVERLLNTKLPKVGATALAGTVRASQGRIVLEALRGTMGATTLAGDLTLETGGPRPRLSGALVLPALDMRPFLLESPDAAAKPAHSLADVYRELEQVAIDIRGLRSIDAELDLQIERWLSLPGEVRDAKLQIKLQDGVLQVPLSWTVADVPLSGRLTADGAKPVPEVVIELGARASRLGGLARLILNAQGVQGAVDSLAVRIAAKGERVRDLLRSLDLRASINAARLSYGNVEGSRPVDLRLDAFELRGTPGAPLAGSLRGALAGQPLSASFSAGEIDRLVREGRTPLKLALQGQGVRADVTGQLAPFEPNVDSRLDFDLVATHAGEVARLLGVASTGRAPIRVKGQVLMSSGVRKVRDLAVQLGRTALTAELEQRTVNGRPFVKGRVVVERLDAEEIQTIMPASSPTAARAVIDIPILPAGVDLTDSEIEVAIKRIDGLRLPVTDVAFDARIRDGEMQPSVFRGRLAEARFDGALALDLRGAEPKAELWLAGENTDIGRLLQRLDITRGIEAQAKLLQLHVVARASRLGDMLRRSSVVAKIEAGRIAIRDANTKSALQIVVREAEVGAIENAPVKLSLAGTIEDVPVSVQIESAPMRELITPGGRVPISLVTELADARLNLAGSMALPASDQDIELSMALSGTKLDRLSRIARTALPPWGPYTAVGRFQSSRRGYAVRDFSFVVGESVLSGNGTVDTARAKPRIDLDLAAERIQLDDFPIGQWSVMDSGGKPEPSKPAGFTDAREAAARASDRMEGVLSREVMQRQDGRVNIVIKQVLAGKDQLGTGRLVASIENGRASIAPVEVLVPGGSARLALAYEPGPRDVAASLRLEVDRFDYGIWARRLRPESDLLGLLSLDVDISGRAAHLNEILKQGNGRIDFGVWPQRMQAGIFDLWAVNLLVALTPVVDPSLASRINCAVGHFDLKQGKLDAQRLLMDTSRMRVIGQGGADFGSEAIGLRLAPRPKEPQFFSLATPVAVGGTFNAYEIQLSPWDVAETVFRQLASVAIVPFQWLFAERLPADGNDVCASAARPAQKKPD